MPGHGLARFRPAQPIALHVVRLPRNQGRQQRGEIGRVHLSICRHHRGEVRTQQERVSATGRNRRANTLIGCVFEHVDGRLDGPRDLRGRVDARVIDDDDMVHEAGNTFEGPADQLLFIVCRHHDGDSFTLEHRGSLGGGLSPASGN